MPFSDAVDLFNYWAKFPPVHVMVAKYLGYEETRGDSPREQNPVEVAGAMRAITGGGGRAQKISRAPARDRERFAALKEQALKERKKK